MGYYASAIAVQSPDRAAVLQSLGFTTATKPFKRKWRSLGPRREGVTVLPSGWTFLLGDFERIDDWRLVAASNLGLAVTCFIVTACDASIVRAFHHGHPVWSVACDPDVYGEDCLHVEGDVPAAFLAIHQRRLAQHIAGEPRTLYLEDGTEIETSHHWLMEAPPDLAAAVCGLRPDYDLFDGAPELNFTSVRRLPRQSKGSAIARWLSLGAAPPEAKR